MGPAFVHAKVTRPYSHSLSDDERLYKTPDERAEEATRDPIVRMAEFLKAEGFASESELESLHKEVEREVNDAAERAIAAEKPGRDTVELFVYSPDVDPTSSDFESEPVERRQAGHHGRGDQPHAEGRNGAQPAHRRVRRGRRRLQPRGGARVRVRARAASSR